MANTYIACDFGAGSGRIIAGTISQNKIELEELHRFPNRQIKLGNHIYWDFPALFEELKTGLYNAAQKKLNVRSIGIDTWGVDFGLIDKSGNLIGNPVVYRDDRTEGMPGEVFKLIDEQALFNETGIAHWQINTLFQLYSMKHGKSSQLDIAKHLLFMPDLFTYFLTGEVYNEYTIASTSELLDARTKKWSDKIIDILGLPRQVFANIIHPGSICGKLKKEIAIETGLQDVDVVAVGSHDTASAIAAIPALGNNWGFLSSGTWSLLGIEKEQPDFSELARSNGFTNEGGVNNRIRFLKNISGLWMLQRLMSEWEKAGLNCNYDFLFAEAEKATPFKTLIDVNDQSFLNPQSMSAAIQNYCISYALPVPVTQAEFVRCALESLALKYKSAVAQLNQINNFSLEKLHVISGGCQNKMLNQFTANALNVPVIAGPVEATALGNILVQAIAKKEISSMEDGRALVKRSFLVEEYLPGEASGQWEEHCGL